MWVTSSLLPLKVLWVKTNKVMRCSQSRLWEIIKENIHWSSRVSQGLFKMWEIEALVPDSETEALSELTLLLFLTRSIFHCCDADSNAVCQLRLYPAGQHQWPSVGQDVDVSVLGLWPSLAPFLITDLNFCGQRQNLWLISAISSQPLTSTVSPTD